MTNNQYYASKMPFVRAQVDVGVRAREGLSGAVMNPLQHLVLVRDRQPPHDWKDETERVVQADRGRDGRVHIAFRGSRVYPYDPNRVLVLAGPAELPIPDGSGVEVAGSLWPHATRLLLFGDRQRGWVRVCYRAGREDGEAHALRPAGDVRVVPGLDAEPHSKGAVVLRYLRDVVDRLAAGDPLRDVYRGLTFVHPESALARYASGEPVSRHDLAGAPVFPFRRNESQRAAAEQALTHSMSVIEGPPGTGKTETILNLVCSLVAAGRTVGVVALGNSAVDNVHEKLQQQDLGAIAARLGNAGTRHEFFTATQDRSAERSRLLSTPPVSVPPQRLDQLDQRLRELQTDDRKRAVLRNRLMAYQLEQEHFQQHLARHDPAPVGDLPLMRQSPERILRFIAETSLDPDARPGFVTRLRRYLAYGSLRGVDPQDGDTLLQLQAAFYRQAVRELEEQVARLDARLAAADLEAISDEYQNLSLVAFRALVRDRIAGRRMRTFDEKTYRTGGRFTGFLEEHPVILSTCHSLRASIDAGRLLDYLIIDEASQVDILAAAPAMASCRHLVIVGDERQLAHVDSGAAAGLPAPHPAYDYSRNSILASLRELYGDALPSTLLSEHYRCHPAIIGYCNKAFYGDKLIPCRTGTGPSMEVRRTVPGNHHRRHRDGARSNQRELDLIAQEVLPDVFARFDHRDIGITTPYRRQADKATDMLGTQDPLDRAQADTVHRFQGRQKRVVILSTVIDSTWRGQTGMPFADDPRLINVAVSRAADRFFLVIDHTALPRSRYIRDLVDYITYQNPGVPPRPSSVVSVFDLLYREYSAVLQPLAERVRGGSAYRSENILGTVLEELMAEDYSDLALVREVHVRDLVSDMSGLTAQEQKFVRHPRTAVDFVLYTRVGNAPLLAIEVDGFAYHEDRPEQQRRDALKDAILRRHGLEVLRLPTTGSGELAKIRTALERVRSTHDGAGIGEQQVETVDLREVTERTSHGPTSRRTDLR
jgi:very-short-patch-repair endonuclease